MAHITVLGAGGWGTALATMAHRYDNEVTLWSPFQQEITAIRDLGENRALLPGVAVPLSMELTTEESCVAQGDLVILAVPSFAVGSTADRIRPFLKDGTPVAIAAKGLDTETHRGFADIVAERLPGARVTVLSGPSHAEEVGRGVPTSVVSASPDMAAARKVQDLLMNPTFRIYVTEDVLGVELGGALKNVIALAAGICDGLQMGDNTKAALMTRGLAEIVHLGTRMGAQADTFYGLSGMGDLIVTCGSMHSRNRRAGILIGQGETPEHAVASGGTVEGYLVCTTAMKLAQEQGVEMPITEACYRVCYEGMAPRDAIEMLMRRPKKHENAHRD